MGAETTQRTRKALVEAVRKRSVEVLNASIEDNKDGNPFLQGVPSILEALQSGHIQCRVYDKDKFHTKASITHAKLEVVGAQALVGSSNFSAPGLTKNIELNVQIQSARDVTQLQEWFEAHWNDATDVTGTIAETVERHTREYTPFDVYAKALQEFFRGHKLTATEWDETRSRMYPRIDRYQKEAYWALMKIARQQGGAFLCDGVGLMLIERLVVGSLLRGELSLARETAESFLRDAESAGRRTEAAAARRNVGLARFWQGDFIGAEANLGEALRTYDPERDRDAKFRFGLDSGASAAAYLTLAIWALGDVEPARALSEEALARADKTGHAPTRANVYHQMSLYQMLRGDPEAIGRMAKIVVDLAREHGMALYLTWGEVYSSWARAWLGERETGILELRKALTEYLCQGNKLCAPLFQGRLAEIEAEGDSADGALKRIDEALALANETGERVTDSMLHRIRAAILLKRDPANSAPAEEALQAAIAIARTQKARSFELQAALALAKLYRSTSRSAAAHAVLAPALEGFAATPEMPEIAKAQALLEQSEGCDSQTLRDSDQHELKRRGGEPPDFASS